jgi:EpsI family protein
MRLQAKFFAMLLLMVAAASAAWALRPTVLIANSRPKVVLAELIPIQFGEWRELPQSAAHIINPQQTELLNKLYSQTLSRSYATKQGAVVMLSIAYGESQSDGIALHYPEVCYPAQGFQVLWSRKEILDTNIGPIPVKRLMTSLGTRSEPVTYWSTLGDRVVYGGLNTKLEQLKFGFRGEIPDGLIFRVSSITRDAKEGHELQAGFVRELVEALPTQTRMRLAGLGK